MGRHIEKPVLDRIPSLRGNPARRARVIDAEEHDTPFSVCKRNQLAGKLLRVGGQHASVPETNLLEFGSSVLSRSELVSDLLQGVKH